MPTPFSKDIFSISRAQLTWILIIQVSLTYRNLKVKLFVLSVSSQKITSFQFFNFYIHIQKNPLA